MKNLFAPLFIILFSQLSAQTSGSGSDYKRYFRFDMGYERNDLYPHNGWKTHAVAFEFEKSFKNSPFSANYRVSIGQTDSGNFYIHIPLGPIAGVLAAFIAAKNNTSSCGGIGIGALLFIVPDGFGFTPLHNDKMAVGIFANFLGVDYHNEAKKYWDYAPDFGVRMNLYFNKKMFAFTRLSGKYSSRYAGWGFQGTAGIGWDFEKE
jgi:hypothetical protein